MGKTALELSHEERRTFHPAEAIRQRRLTRRVEYDLHRDKALRVARQAAELLKQEYGASRVVLFGSLAQDDRITPWSDVDLAAWGIRPDTFYTAVAQLSDLHPEIEIDLIDADRCQQKLRLVIEREGIEL
jgi:predicted nucleotidyltransferase